MNLYRNPWHFIFIAVIPLVVVASAYSCRSEQNLERSLKRLELEYRIDEDGDFRVKVPAGNGTEAVVGVSLHTILLDDDVRVREVWAVVGRIPGRIPDDLAEDLLTDSWSSRKFGSWALAGTTSDQKQVLVYLVRIPENASHRLLRAAMIDAAVSSTELKQALRSLLED